MAVDSTTFVILLQPSLYVFESFEIFLKLLMSGGRWVLIVFDSKEKEIILIQLTKIHLSTRCCINHVGLGSTGGERLGRTDDHTH